MLIIESQNEFVVVCLGRTQKIVLQEHVLCFSSLGSLKRDDWLLSCAPG